MLCISVVCIVHVCFVFFFKQKTAYEMRISDWSSDVCSSDLSSVGNQLLTQSEVLNDLLARCQAANTRNGQSIQVQQAATANQLRILNGGEIDRKSVV